MNLTDQLQNISELAIAMAGFAGIVFVLGNSSKTSDINNYRIVNLLSISFMTMFVALNSIGLELLSIDKEMHPRLSSGLMFILFGVLLSTYSFPRYFKIGFATRSDFGKIIGMIIVPIIVINLAIQLINSLGYFGSSSAGVFYYGLLVMLMAAAVQFMTIILDREVLGIEK